MKNALGLFPGGCSVELQLQAEKIKQPVHVLLMRRCCIFFFFVCFSVDTGWNLKKKNLFTKFQKASLFCYSELSSSGAPPCSSVSVTTWV